MLGALLLAAGLRAGTGDAFVACADGARLTAETQAALLEDGFKLDPPDAQTRKDGSILIQSRRFRGTRLPNGAERGWGAVAKLLLKAKDGLATERIDINVTLKPWRGGYLVERELVSYENESNGLWLPAGKDYDAEALGQRLSRACATAAGSAAALSATARTQAPAVPTPAPKAHARRSSQLFGPQSGADAEP